MEPNFLDAFSMITTHWPVTRTIVYAAEKADSDGHHRELDLLKTVFYVF